MNLRLSVWIPQTRDARTRPTRHGLQLKGLLLVLLQESTSGIVRNAMSGSRVRVLRFLRLGTFTFLRFLSLEQSPPTVAER